jgi:hypothetical protein
LAREGTGLMTILGLGATEVRRWYILLTDGLAPVRTCSFFQAHQGAYSGRAKEVAPLPLSRIQPNTFSTWLDRVVMLAGVIAKAINGPCSEPKTASPDATIADRGVRKGAFVPLSDPRGQRAPSFRRQVFDRQLVAHPRVNQDTPPTTIVGSLLRFRSSG